MNETSDLKLHLQQHLRLLRGDWVKKKDGYEGMICSLLGMLAERSRYWDARWNSYLLEFKKGRSIWLDLVRYSEVMLQVSESATKETLTLFFIPDADRQRIEQIVCVETQALLDVLRLHEISAEFLVGLHEKVPHGLNAQARLTVDDVRGMALFIVR